MRSNKKMVIFDMDGVLFDSVKLAHEHTLRIFPGITDEMHKELLNGNFHEGIKKIEHLRITETDEEKELRKRKYAEEKSKMPLYNGVEDFLKHLHSNGYILALNTSAYDRNTVPLLEKAGILEMFDFLGTADISKSKAEKFKIMEEKYGFKNDEVIFVTDTLGDLLEAKVAGIPTVCVTWGAHNREYFTREAHANLVGIVDNFEELKKFI